MEGKLIKVEDGYLLIDVNTSNEDRWSVIGSYPFNKDVEKLSLKNCEAVANGYDLDELVEDNFKGLRACIEDQDIAEFYISLVKTTVTEILGDKKFSEEDLKKSWSEGYHRKVDEINGGTLNYFDDLIQSLQKTKWDVEIEMECCGKYTRCNSNCRNNAVPKLDADGCLILKRK